MTALPQESLRRGLSSTQSATPSSRITSPVNVKWWGALNDGSAQAASAINAAIDFVSALGGGTVIVPRGTYLVSGIAGQRIYLKTKVRLEFEAGCAINSGQHGATSQIIMVDTAQQATIENVTIEGNGLVITGNQVSAFTQYGVMVNAQTAGDVLRNILIRDIIVKDVRTDGITTGGNAGVWAENVTWERIICDNAYRNGGSTVSGKKIFHRDCIFKNTVGASPKAGFDLEPDAGLTADDVVFDNCQFLDNDGHGLYVQTTMTGRVTTINCLAEGNGETGIVMNATGPFILKGTISRTNTLRGFHVECDAGHVAMSDCIAHGNGNTGFLLPGSKSLAGNNLVSYGNSGSGFDVGTITAVAGIQTLTNCTAYGNTLKGFIHNRGMMNSFVGCTSFNNLNDGIQLYAAQNCQVVGCTSIGNSSTVDANGDNIIVESNSNWNNISNNICRMAARFFSGTATAGGASTVTLPATANVESDDWYNGLTIRITSGTGSGQSKTISDYVAATRVVTVSVAWSTVPDGTSVVEITNGARPRYGIRVNAGCTSNKVTDNDLYLSGTTGALSDAGTSTVTTSANRTS